MRQVASDNGRICLLVGSAINGPAKVSLSLCTGISNDFRLFGFFAADIQGVLLGGARGRLRAVSGDARLYVG